MLRSLNLNVSVTVRGPVIEIETMDGAKLTLQKHTAGDSAILRPSNVRAEHVECVVSTELNPHTDPITISSASFLFDLLADLVS